MRVKGLAVHVRLIYENEKCACEILKSVIMRRSRCDIEIYDNEIREGLGVHVIY